MFPVLRILSVLLGARAHRVARTRALSQAGDSNNLDHTLE